METQLRQFQNLLSETAFSTMETSRLSRYYHMVLKWNPRLHLTTITGPREFLDRHVHEAAFAARHLAADVRQVWDIGSGLGVPGVVIAILRPDLALHLVESGRKKALFLEEVASALPLPNARVVPSRFESLPPLPEDACLTARAVEEMEEILPRLAALAHDCRQILLLGSDRIASRLKAVVTDDWQVHQFLLPNSSRRYLIDALRST